jgi:hypothetical protein
MSIMMKKITILCLAFVTSFGLKAQNGADEPCSATVLTVATSCAASTASAGAINTPAFTNSTSASAGVTLPALTCGGFTTTTRDFWYQCVVPTSGKVTIVVDLGTVTTTYSAFWDMALYTSNSATCAGSTFTELTTECANAQFPYFQQTGLTPGSTLYIRMWRQAGSDQTVPRSFAISALEGSVLAPVTCPALITPATGAVLKSDPLISWTRDPLATKKDITFGSSLAALLTFANVAARTTTIDSFKMPGHTYTGGATPAVYVAPGVTNYVYVVQKNCVTNPNTSCTPVAYTAAAIPANDDCVGAIPLNTVDVYKKYSSASSSQSQAAAACSGATSSTASDVWFSFKTIAAGDVILGLKSSNLMDAVIQAFSGTCGSLTPITCTDDAGAPGEELLLLPALAANTTYYVRVYNYYQSTPTPINYLYGEEFEIAISGSIVIPVELTSFTGKTQGVKNALNWHTASERDAQSFIVERSADGGNAFEAIGTIKAAGTTSTPQDYAFLDENPMPMSYYRLRQVDLNGKENLSKTINIQRKDKKFTLDKAFPSPVSSELTVQYSAERNGNLTLQVVDIFGRLILTKDVNATEGGNVAKLNLENVATGAYVLMLTDGQKTVQTRVVKQ